MLHMLKHIAYCQPLSCLLALSCIRYVDTKQLQSYHFIYKTIRKGLYFIKKLIYVSCLFHRQLHGMPAI